MVNKKKSGSQTAFCQKDKEEEEKKSSRLTRTRSVTHQGNVNEWNNKAVEITGFSVDDIMGRNLVEEFILVTFYICQLTKAHTICISTLHAALHTRT